MGINTSADKANPQGDHPASPDTNLRLARRFLATAGWFGRSQPVGAAAAVVVAVLVVLAIFGPLIAPQDPLELHTDSLLKGPGTPYLLGTDDLGRDVLSRLIAGTRPALFIAISSVLLGASIGGLLGLITGFRGGWLDAAIQRFIDGLLAFPALVLALAIVAALGPQDINVMIAVAVVNVPIGNRVMRSVVLSVKQEAYIEAAMAIGASDTRIMLRHILPQTMAPFMVVATGQVAWGIIVAASLSFLGVASPPPDPSWGRMMAEGVRIFAERAPWLAISPGILISLSVFAFTMLGDSMRDVLDPKMRGSERRG